MFWKKKRSPSKAQTRVRGALLGNQSLEACALVAQEQELYEEPWQTYVRAQELVASDQSNEALRLLEGLAPRPNLASRHYAQIYHHLRSMGSRVDLPLRLLGVVVESGKGPKTYDLLGAYVDRSAQFYPEQGGHAHWARPNASLDESIGIVITMGEVLLPKTPLWTGGDLPLVEGDQLRLTFVASQGLYVLEGSREELVASMIVDRLYTAAEDLMQRMRGLLHEGA